MVSDLNKDALCIVKPPISTHPWDLENNLLGRSGHLWKVIVCKADAQVIKQVQGAQSGNNAGLPSLWPRAWVRLLFLILAPRVLLRFLRFSFLHKNQCLQIPSSGQVFIQVGTSRGIAARTSRHGHASTTICFAFHPAVFEEKRDCSQSNFHSSACFAGWGCGQCSVCLGLQQNGG